VKRMILCPPCSEKWNRTPRDPGERRKAVGGTLRAPAFCDGCGAALKAGERAAAFTVWFEGRLNPYHPWEDQYLDVGTRAQRRVRAMGGLGVMGEVDLVELLDLELEEGNACD